MRSSCAGTAGTPSASRGPPDGPLGAVRAPGPGDQYGGGPSLRARAARVLWRAALGRGLAVRRGGQPLRRRRRGAGGLPRAARAARGGAARGPTLARAILLRLDRGHRRLAAALHGGPPGCAEAAAAPRPLRRLHRGRTPPALRPHGPGLATARLLVLVGRAVELADATLPPSPVAGRRPVSRRARGRAGSGHPRRRRAGPPQSGPARPGRS